MAKSSHATTLYPSTAYLESAGCIVFDFRETSIDPFTPTPTTHSSPTSRTPTSPSLILIHSRGRNEILLPKGRLNISEPRHVAALRETREETGLECRLLPITLHSRATSANPADDAVNDAGFTVDEVRTFRGVVHEPFMCAVREAGGRGERRKFIWWFVAGVVREVEGEVLDPGCEVLRVRVEEALERLTFEDDREVVREAVRRVQETLGVSWADLAEAKWQEGAATRADGA